MKKWWRNDNISLDWLRCNFFMIRQKKKTASDKPWQNMLHDKTIPSSKVKRLKRIKSYQKLPPFGKFAEAATRGVLWVRVFFEISKNPQENTCNGLRAATLLKKALAQVFSCEFCEISKNNFFTEHLWTTASEFVTEMLIFRSRRSQMFFKIGVLKNFAVLEPLSNKVAGLLLRNTCGGCFWLFAASNTFLGLNMVFTADSRTGFCSGLLWTIRLATLLKRDSNTDAFAWNLRNF